MPESDEEDDSEDEERSNNESLEGEKEDKNLMTEPIDFAADNEEVTAKAEGFPSHM